jgi:enterochelin esterase family protein
LTLAIRRFLDAGDLSPAAIDQLLAAHRCPIVEGSTVTFLYRGPADAVHLQHFIYGLATAQPFTPIAGTDLWYLIQEIPVRSRVEYKLGVQIDGQSRLIRDPLNPELAHDPFGANSVCQGAEYVVPEWARRDPEARPGTIERVPVRSRALERDEEVAVYLPPRFRASRRYAVVVAHDGLDYLRFSSLQTVLDNLIDRGEIAPLVVALTQSPARLREYADDERHARFVAEELLPALEARYPIAAGAEQRGLMGASFGAVAALSVATRYPGRFGRLLLQSGSFAFTDIGPNKHGPVLEPVVAFVNGFREKPRAVAEKVFLSCGVYEGIIYENRSFVPLLEQTGMQIRYVEAWDGHNWENWRDRLREGLSWLFPGALWMTYE